MVVTNDNVIVCRCLKARDVYEMMKKRLDELDRQANSLAATNSQLTQKKSKLTSSKVKYCLCLENDIFCLT